MSKNHVNFWEKMVFFIIVSIFSDINKVHNTEWDIMDMDE